MQAAAFEIADNALTREYVELTGFEPVTPSLRKMQSKPPDQGKRHSFKGLWRGCGTSHVRHGKTRQAFLPSPSHPRDRAPVS